MNEIPYMQRVDIDAMAKLLNERKPEKVLEYGAGASTIYWPKRCQFIKLWVAIEHDQEWASTVIEQTLLAKLPYIVCVMDEQMQSYVNPPAEFVPFDLIVVDGIHRIECVRESEKYLLPGGVVLLHDADRLEYKLVLDMYPHHEFLTHGNTPDGKGGMKRDGLLLMWGDA